MSPSKIQIIVAFIALVGSLLGGMFGNWEKIFGKVPQASSPASSPTTIVHGDVTGALVTGNVSGDVNVRVEKSPVLEVKEFAGDISSDDGVSVFEEFLAKNRGKIVKIVADISDDFHEWTQSEERAELVLGSPCDQGERNFCWTSRIGVGGRDFQASWYKGGLRFNGYFLVDETIEMHQGIHFGMSSVNREQIVSQLQRK